MKPTSGEKACGFLAFRGLSAAPLGAQSRNQISRRGYEKAIFVRNLSFSFCITHGSLKRTMTLRN
jgi:hypothetical protein